MIEGKDAAFSALDEKMTTEWMKKATRFSNICLQKILPESMEECPVLTGAMQGSAPGCSSVEITPTEAIATLGYGGPSSAYCLKQHEDLSLHHKVGKAKFLEDPVMRNAEIMAELMQGGE